MLNKCAALHLHLQPPSFISDPAAAEKMHSDGLPSGGLVLSEVHFSGSQTGNSQLASTRLNSPPRQPQVRLQVIVFFPFITTACLTWPAAAE